MHLPAKTQHELIRALRQKRNVDRFMFRRSQLGLALELGVSQPTINNTEHKNQRLGKLTPDEVAHVKRMRFEYAKHKEEAKQWTLRNIAKRLGIGKRTAERWNQRLLNGEIL